MLYMYRLIRSAKLYMTLFIFVQLCKLQERSVLMFVVLCNTMNSSGWGTRDFSSDSTVHDYHILYLFIMTL